jgi:hypothetical protein
MEKSSYNDKHQGRDRTGSRWQRLCPVIGIGLLSILGCGCESVTFDVRTLPQPIVLNSNPFLAPPDACPFVVTHVDNYAASVEYAESSWLAEDKKDEVTQYEKVNDLQLRAFEKIAGQTNRFIRNVTLDASAHSIYAIFFTAQRSTVAASGDVCEFHGATTNAQVGAGGTPP